MTGRELIVYILEHRLEDEEMFKNGAFLGFMTIGEAAGKFEVGTETIKTWCMLGHIEWIRFGDELFIPGNATKPSPNKSSGTVY